MGGYGGSMGLTPLLIVLVVLVVAVGALSRLAPQRSARSAGKLTFPYYGKKALFSAAERSFLGVLGQAVEGRYLVFGKVRLADVLGVKAGTSAGERQRALNRLLAKHVDFVLCRPEDLSIAALVELDDGSHKRTDRQARDAFLEQACAAAGMQLLRFPVRTSYALSDVRAGLVPLIGSTAPVTPPTPSAPSIGRPGSRS